MSRSELHNWECAIESLCGDKVDKMLAIAQDIYNTAYVRGKNYMSLEQESVLDKIRTEIVDLGQRTMNDNRASGIWACRDIIDKYRTEREVKYGRLDGRGAVKD